MTFPVYPLSLDPPITVIFLAVAATSSIRRAAYGPTFCVWLHSYQADPFALYCLYDLSGACTRALLPCILVPVVLLPLVLS